MIRYALRSLARSKGFATVAILSLALALGLNTTTFALLDAFMHPTVPYRDPQRLVTISVQGDPRQERISWAERDAMLKERIETFSDSVAYERSTIGIVRTGQLEEEMFYSEVSPNYFQILGLAPERGRTFETSSGENLVVVSRRFWLRALGGVTALEGLDLTIDDRVYAVVGIMPDDRNSPRAPQIWRMGSSRFQTGWVAGAGSPILRLRDGVTVDDVKEDMTRLGKQLENQFGIVRMPFKYGASTLQPDPYGLSGFHVSLAASAFAILLIACANLANLMAARGVARRRDLALHLAVGAQRGDLIRALVTEAAILAVAGGLLGIFASLWGVSAIRGAIPQMEFVDLRTPSVSWRIFAFAAAASALAVMLFGLLPAIRASDVDVAEPLKEGAGSHTGRVRRHSWLAIVQVALALVLVITATVSARSAYRIATRMFGFDVKGLHLIIVNLDRKVFSDASAVSRVFDQAQSAARAIPGVKGVATVAYPRTMGGVILSDFDVDTVSRMMSPSYTQVSEDFLRTLGLPIVKGRDFAPGDRATGGGVIINESAAQILYAGENPVGRLIKMGLARSPAPWLRVIGVAKNSNYYGQWNPYIAYEPPQVWVLPAVDSALRKSIVFRIAATDTAGPALVARSVRAITGSTRFSSARPWSMNYSYQVGVTRFTTRVFTVLGICGLGLAAMGLYGVLAYAVSRRLREFAVRMALGATPEQVFRIVMHDGAVMYLAGTGIGAFAALTTYKVLDYLQFNVAATDAVSLVIAEVVLILATVIACVVPARRAMRSDPVEILRAS